MVTRLRRKKLSYAVVLNPPARRSVAQQKQTKKLKELGRLYQDMKKNGNAPQWRSFLSRAMKGAKFNPPVMSGRGVVNVGVSFASTFGILWAVQKKIRIHGFKNYLIDVDYSNKPKEAMNNYYGLQIAGTLLAGTTTTAVNFAVAKAIKGTSAGKHVSPKAVMIGSGIATVVAALIPTIQYWKCKGKNYTVAQIVKKEVDAWAKDASYFGEEFKEGILRIKSGSSDYDGSGSGNTSTSTSTTETNEIEDTEDNNVGGIYYNDNFVGDPIPMW